jgi:catechol 2,3-dioxygenase-like lactoylglutathione lyase family enzyme
VLRRIHHAQILIPAGREDEARAFYCGLLGLSEIEKPPVLRARGGFWLQVGPDCQLHVGVEREGRDESLWAGSREHVAYEVDDIDAWWVRLNEHGIALKITEEVPGYRRGELRDPFGNRIELMSPMR